MERDQVSRAATLAEIAHAAGCSVRTIRRRIRDGALAVPSGAKRVRSVPVAVVAQWSAAVYESLLQARVIG